MPALERDSNRPPALADVPLNQHSGTSPSENSVLGTPMFMNCDMGMAYNVLNDMPEIFEGGAGDDVSPPVDEMTSGEGQEVLGNEGGDGQIDDSGDEVAVSKSAPQRQGVYKFPPTQVEIEGAMEDIEQILEPPQKDNKQSYKDPAGLDKHTVKRLNQMVNLCQKYLEYLSESPDNARGHWTKASVEVAKMVGKTKKGSKKPGEKRAQKLRR